MQASNVPNAISNEVLDLLAWTSNLTFLDISFAKNVTDDGLLHFKERTLPLKKLFINGMIGATGLGLGEVINSCKSTLRICEAGYLD